MHPWALVTPASRGIGLELAKRILQTTSIPVIATARKDVDQTKQNVLSGLKEVNEDRLSVVKLDFLGNMIMTIRCANSG
jgi:NAD(P)-dependent dehydrogenase (short-subunit alcohol dehydrogenase family)